MDPNINRSDLLGSVSLDQRLHCKPTHHDVLHTQDHNDTHEMLSAQYINLHRLPDNLPKVQLDALPNDLLGHHVVEIPSTGSMVSPNVTTSYYGEDLLGNDLTEEDKKLAEALVAVQLVHQQKQSNLLPSEILNTKSMAPLSPFTHSIEKPGMAAMVTSYIQAFEEETAAAQQLLETQPSHTNQTTVLDRKFSPPPQQLSDIRLPPLPPLKKVLSTQNLLKSKSKKSYIEHLDPDPDKSCELPKIDDIDTGIDDHCLDDIDSDYEIDNDLKPSRRSLPHKKRIPRKLKTQPQRNIHSKCYKCQKCGDSFSNQSSFFNHRSQHSNPPKRINLFTCEICQFQTSTQMQFYEHLKAHYEPKNAVESVMQTDLVDFNTSQVPCIDDSFALKDPSMDFNKKGDMTPKACEQCGKVFRRQRLYESHKATAHQQNTIEEFSEPEDMMEGIRHVVNIQAGCPDDDAEEKQMRVWKDLTATVPQNTITSSSTPEKSCDQSDSFEESPPTSANPSKKKPKPKELSCPHCPRVFIHRTSLIYHIRSHSGRRPHQCDVCGKSFFANNALKVHMRMHSGDKPYKCETCGRCFRQWGDLKYHITSLHSTQKQYQCEFCGKDFARKYSLIVHRRIHTNEKNYVCEFCCKTFRASSYLVNHRRIHTGEKPHSCEICKKAFRVKSDLKRHLLTHNKVRNNIAGSLVITNPRCPSPSDIVVNNQQVNTSTGIVVTSHQAAAAVTMVHQQHTTAQIISQSDEPECILPDVSAPLNLMRSDTTDGITYTRDGLAIERTGNTLYVWLPAGDSILSDE